jgi:hypothetical protein
LNGTALGNLIYSQNSFTFYKERYDHKKYYKGVNTNSLIEWQAMADCYRFALLFLFYYVSFCFIVTVTKF